MRRLRERERERETSWIDMTGGDEHRLVLGVTMDQLVQTTLVDASWIWRPHSAEITGPDIDGLIITQL